MTNSDEKELQNEMKQTICFEYIEMWRKNFLHRKASKFAVFVYFDFFHYYDYFTCFLFVSSLNRFDTTPKTTKNSLRVHQMLLPGKRNKKIMFFSLFSVFILFLKFFVWYFLKLVVSALLRLCCCYCFLCNLMVS